MNNLIDATYKKIIGVAGTQAMRAVGIDKAEKTGKDVLKGDFSKSQSKAQGEKISLSGYLQKYEELYKKHDEEYQRIIETTLGKTDLEISVNVMDVSASDDGTAGGGGGGGGEG